MDDYEEGKIQNMEAARVLATNGIGTPESRSLEWESYGYWENAVLLLSSSALYRSFWSWPVGAAGSLSALVEVLYRQSPGRGPRQRN